MTTIRKKSAMTGSVFSGISAVYAVKDGFTISDNNVSLSDVDLVELPVSESGGVNINGGSPSTSVFRVHGLSVPWTSRTTPGDTEVSLQIPCYDGEVLKLIYGYNSDGHITVGSISSGADDGGLAGNWAGIPISFPEKSVNLGLLILNDTADKMLFVKKIKVLASPEFNGEDTPFVINLTGSVEGGAEKGSLAILEKETATNNS